MFQELQIDDEWSTRSDRSFRWWPHRLAQRVWAEDLQQDEGSAELDPPGSRRRGRRLRQITAWTQTTSMGLGRIPPSWTPSPSRAFLVAQLSRRRALEARVTEARKAVQYMAGYSEQASSFPLEPSVL